MRWRRFVGLVTVALLVSWTSAETRAGTIINGDFATGDFTGWTASAFDDAFNPIVPADPFINVAGFGAGNAAQFETGEFADGLFVAALEQSYTISAAEPLLSLEFTLPDLVPDGTGTGASLFPDSLFVLLDSSVGFFELLLVDDFGALADPFGTAPGDVSLGAPLDPAYDFRFDVDLSSLAGLPVTLIVESSNEDNGQSATFIASNFTMEAPKPVSKVIPEPSSVVLWSLLGLIAVGIGLRNRRGMSCQVSC